MRRVLALAFAIAGSVTMVIGISCVLLASAITGETPMLPRVPGRNA